MLLYTNSPELCARHQLAPAWACFASQLMPNGFRLPRCSLLPDNNHDQKEGANIYESHRKS